MIRFIWVTVNRRDKVLNVVCSAVGGCPDVVTVGELATIYWLFGSRSSPVALGVGSPQTAGWFGQFGFAGLLWDEFGIFIRLFKGWADMLGVDQLYETFPCTNRTDSERKF